MKLTWLRILGVLIWFAIEAARWLERRNLINNLSKDLMQKFKNVQTEIALTVQSSRPVDLSTDPDNRDNG